MPNILYPPPRPQSVGEILDSAFRIFRATLLQCLPYIYYLATGRGAVARIPALIHDPVWWTLYVLGYLIAVVLWSAVLLRQYAIATGGPVATGAELATGLRRLPGMVLLGILT